MYFDAFLEWPHVYGDCFIILDLGAKGELEIFTSASCLLQVMYFLKKDKMSNRDIMRSLNNTLSFCKILCSTNQIFMESFSRNSKDLEDAIQYQTAIGKSGMDYFITSNAKDFKLAHQELAVLTPSQFVHLTQKN